MEIAKYPFKVDYGLDVEELVRAGQYDSSYPFTSREAPMFSGLGVVAIEALIITELSGNIYDHVRVADEIRSLDCRGANLREMLCFGAEYPQAQLETKQIIATGTMVGDPLGRCYPKLWGMRNWRDYETFRGLGVWWHKWAFFLCGLLVVPKGTPGR